MHLHRDSRFFFVWFGFGFVSRKKKIQKLKLMFVSVIFVLFIAAFETNKKKFTKTILIYRNTYIENRRTGKQAINHEYRHIEWKMTDCAHALTYSLFAHHFPKRYLSFETMVQCVEEHRCPLKTFHRPPFLCGEENNHLQFHVFFSLTPISVTRAVFEQ